MKTKIAEEFTTKAPKKIKIKLTLRLIISMKLKIVEIFKKFLQYLHFYLT